MTFIPLPSHPLAELFPMMADADIASMADDICTFGQRHKIVLLDGLVLDGRNRQAACVIADVEPEYEAYEGDDPLNFVLSLNRERRHLSASQRAMVAAKIVDWEIGLNQTTGSANLPTRTAARQMSISERAVVAAKRIRDHGTDQLVAAIQDGRIKVHAGEALSYLEQQEQNRVLAEEDKQITARAKQIRRDNQEKKHAGRLLHMTLVANAGAKTSGKIAKRYGVYYADPPWQFGVHSEVTGREKSAENHYPTMPTPEIIALFTELGENMPRDAVLFLWATNPMLPQGLAVLAAAGFTCVHHWIWDKEVAGTGYWGRDRHELLLIGRRGEPATPLPGTQPETVHRERKGAHSAKPDYYAEQIERLYPGVPKLELFCRSPRPGWDVWGFEATDDGAAYGRQIDEIDLSREGLRATPPEGARATKKSKDGVTA
jgi:N6-adenosine-specific RNA methylase IME4